MALRPLPLFAAAAHAIFAWLPVNEQFAVHVSQPAEDASAIEHVWLVTVNAKVPLPPPAAALALEGEKAPSEQFGVTPLVG